jgi:DNA-binding response OmpR family regulator
MKRILIIEDDISIAEIERDFLEIEGFEVVISNDGLDGYNKAIKEKFNLILLDLMLPNMSGYEICKNIRNEIDVPILMVSAKGDEPDKIRGLGLGADDYIAKPFSPSELVARVKSNIAQYERLKSKNDEVGTGSEKTEDTIQIGSILVNLPTHRVHVNKNEIELKNKEYELLTFLITNPDIVFSKEHLYERIWGMDAFGDLKTVTVHINRLREKIEKDPQNPEYIQTVWGAGYRFKR